MLTMGGAVSWAEDPDLIKRESRAPWFTSPALCLWMPGTSCLPLLPPGLSHCNGLYAQTLSLNKPFSLQVSFVRCFVIATKVTNKVAMLGLNCLCEVFFHWTCSKEYWALVCHRINQRATLPTSFHPQMLPIAEEHTGPAWCSCQTEALLARMLAQTVLSGLHPWTCFSIGKWASSELACIILHRPPATQTDGHKCNCARD